MMETCKVIAIVASLLFASTAISYSQMVESIVCREQSISLSPEEGTSLMIPHCMDTLRIGSVPALPRSPATVDPVCARLYRIKRTAQGVELTEIPTKTLCDSPNFLTLIPETYLEAEVAEGEAQWYEVVMYCSYWHGLKTPDTSRFQFRKATGFKAFARAVDIETGEDVTALNLVAPVYDNKDHYISDGMHLTAYEGSGYTFISWTSKNARDLSMLPSLTERRQPLRGFCWPVQRDVEFIGLFQKVSTGVPGDRNDGYEIVVQPTSVRIRARPPRVASVRIYDVQGVAVLTAQLMNEATSIATDGLATGFYTIVVQGSTRTATHSFMHFKE